MTGTRDPGEGHAGLSGLRRAGAMAALCCAVALVIVAGTMVGVALPTLAGVFRASDAASVWIVNAYQMAMITALLPLTALSPRIGAGRLFCAGLALFGLAGLGCALCENLPALLALRVLQGLGGAAVMGVNAFLVERIYPPSLLGRGLGINTATISLSVIAAPTLASLVLAWLDWRWLFAVPVPLGAAALALGLRFLPATKAAPATPGQAAGQGPGSLSPVALVLHLLTLAGLFLATGGIAHGVSPAACTAAGAGFLLCGYLYLRNQKASAAPVLPLDLFARREFGLSAFSLTAGFMAQAATVTACPFFFQHALGFSAVETGLLLTSWPCAHIVASLASGRLIEKADPHVVCLAGLALCGAGMFSLPFLGPGCGAMDVAARLAICGLGYGLFQAPNDTVALLSAPHARRSAASAVLALGRSLGQALGTLCVAGAYRHCADGNRPTLLLAAGLAFVGTAALAARLAHSTRHRPKPRPGRR